MDADYFVQHLTNCCLINLEDMLQNGTVINKVMIEKPHRLITATTIATQIITAVTSSQYGGASISLTHLAPFVRDSYNRYVQKYRDYGLNVHLIEKFAREDLKKEINDAVQTFNYQCNSMSTTNGQAPFLTVFMYLSESEEYKEEVAMLIEEFLKQRMLGLKNEVGVYVTQAFPKLIYVLEEDNITEDSKYWYLTELASKCTAKRMVPDYISEKVMKSLKIDANGEGHCYPVMGCVDGNSVIDYKIDGTRYVESFERAWERISDIYSIKKQPDNINEYINTDDIKIYDMVKNKYVTMKRIIRNNQSDWMDIEFTGGRYMRVTTDHPFEVEDIGVVLAKDLKPDYKIRRLTAKKIKSEKTTEIKFNHKAWVEGLILCDSSYEGSVTVSLGLKEDDILLKLSDYFKSRDTVIRVRDRGKKGKYIDYTIRKSKDLSKYFIELFSGVAKKHRQIPSYIFNSKRDIKMSFLAGMIDADGYVNNSNSVLRVQIGSTNEELALQQMMLAIDLGFNATVYKNKYKKNSDKIRYRVEFNCTEELSKYLISKKKADHYIDEKSCEGPIISSEFCQVKKIEFYSCDNYSYDVTTDSEHFTVNGIYSHNCRSALTPYLDTNDKPKYYGRFNQGVVTISLPDIAFSSGGDFDKFWELFEERTELVHKALRCRHDRLLNTLSDVAPVMWQNGALARLSKGTPINELLYGGYSTLSMGYAGLYECVKYMTGKSHMDGAEGEEFGLKVMQALNDKCYKWRDEEDIAYSLYGTPLESTTYKFAKALKNRFGKDIFIQMDGKDRDYITNSYHCPVFEEIDPFEKLRIESKFQALSPGGAISYIECADLTHNTDAVLEVMKFIYDNIMYAELNTKSDYCHVCGYDGEIKIIDEDGELKWECPNCGNRDQSKMNVSRRSCGYIGTNFWNQGRTDEIANRYVHLDNHEV